jgi:predicted transposase YbfD/YdcC
MPQIVPPLATVLADVPDSRDPRGVRHPLRAVLSLSCVAMRCGARGASAIAEWAEDYGEEWRGPLGFTRPDAPSPSTVQRIFKGIDGDLLEVRLGEGAAHVIAARPAPAETPLPLEAMAIAGKTLRCSAKCGADDAHLLSAFSQRLGGVLAQVAVPDKTHDITAIDALLARRVLTGWVVTSDALLTQADGAQTICDAGGDSRMTVKRNQPTWHDDLAVLCAEADAVCLHAQEIRMHGGRIERRRVRAATALTGDAEGPGCAQALCVERRVTHKATGETRTDVAYAITSLTPTAAPPAPLLVLWRAQWQIENQSHWISGCPLGGMPFDADRSTVRAGRIPQVMAARRSTAISLARLHGATNIAAACRRYAAQPALALAALGLTPRL